ncbi:hypothetical protein [Nocardioides marmorisolisilvae]|uniref:hypothetical protein n=1 Tax=Nocardioides marmorisolisilvae TaxID=1542737 RepID=UPI0011CD954F|nr:hypothetical protein [Nocardioides marmorisolisilvae]
MTAVRTRSLGTAIRQLGRQPDRILVPAVVLTVVGLIANVLVNWLIGLAVGSTPCPRYYLGTTLTARCAGTTGRGQLGVLVGLFVLFLIGHLVAAGLSRASLDLIDEVPSRGVFGGWNLLRALPAAVTISLLLTLGTVLVVLPGLLLAFFTRYAMTFVVDRGLGTWSAIAASTRLVARNLVRETGFAVTAVAVLVLGLLALEIGLLIAVPLVLLAQTYRYRTLA